MLNSELLGCVLDIGEQMLISGAEINRVENTICRICQAYQAKRTDVFTITSSIVVTVHSEDGSTLTQTRRIHNYSINLNKLDKLNSLSRYICAYRPEIAYIREEIGKIEREKPYGSRVQYFIFALIAGSFTVFFGGDWSDALVSAIIGILLKLLVLFVQKVDKNLVLVNVLCSFAVGTLAVFAVKSGIGHNFEKVIIGNIMLLIPGLTLTNSIRDIISGDTMSGLLRLSESIVLALSVAVGFGLSSLLLGGGLL